MNLGIGVMLNMLGGNSSTVNAFNSSLNKKIDKVFLDEQHNVLVFEFGDGARLKIYDDGQSCCETRYMRTDDTLIEFYGAILLGAEIKDAPNITDQYGDHEVQFLEIKTDKGAFTMASHNEHNGYYGGFAIVCELEDTNQIKNQ